MIKEIIVVEGKSDTVAVRRSVEAETIETGGSAINEVIYNEIKLAQERRGVIVFTDPDHAGERLRRLITERVPGCKHAFLPLEEARGKRKIGIEHATPQAIRKALEGVKTDYGDDAAAEPAEIGWEDLMEAGLIVHPDAGRRRLEIGRRLGFGYANGKQFFKRCQMFRISRREFDAAVESFEKEAAKK